MRAVLYIRVSHEDQVNEGHSLAMQEERLRAYCTMRALDVAEVIVDAGVSAGKPLATRAGGARLLELVAVKQADAVVAFKLDRLFRRAADALVTAEGWNEAGIGLHLVDFGGMAVDTTSAAGWMFFTMLAGFAEFERRQCGERIKAVKAHCREAGMFLGGTAPYGYRQAADGGLEPDEEEQAVIADARELREAGLSLRRVGERLAERGYLPRSGGKWHAETVKALLAAGEAA